MGSEMCIRDRHPYSQPAWATGNTFNGFLTPGQDKDVYEATREINRTAMKSPILGFAPDQESVKVEVANCKAVLDEYLDSLDLGIVELESNYNAFIEKLKAAGVDKLIADLNKQLTDWRNNR